MSTMNFKFDTDKIVTLAKANLKYLPWLVVGLISVTFMTLTYFALYPRVDSDHVAEGEARVQSLDIRFNLKLLNELGATKTPTQLGTAGGRDPFAGF